MAISDLPVFQILKSKMQWHQARQGVLAQNVANSDTPGYRGKDLKAFDFARQVTLASTGLDTAVTSHGHMVGSMKIEGSSARSEDAGSFEVTPDGNSVVLEEEMMKVTENQMDYQAVTTLYAKSLGLIRSALSSRG
jgi:flagellar basal-body rod protein FlgB